MARIGYLWFRRFWQPQPHEWPTVHVPDHSSLGAVISCNQCTKWLPVLCQTPRHEWPFHPRHYDPNATRILCRSYRKRFGLWTTLLTMFTGKPQKNRGAATTYFDEHLSHNDYYSQRETQAGQWIGVGAEKLGLKTGEIVTREAFLRLRDNLHPMTRERLTPGRKVGGGTASR